MKFAEQLRQTQDRIIKLLKKEKELTPTNMHKLLGMHYTTVQAALWQLEKKGKVVMLHESRGGHKTYVLGGEE